MEKIIEERLKNDPMIKIVKRDGVSVVEYNPNKIVNVLTKAMQEDNELGIDIDLAYTIENEIYEELLHHKELHGDLALTVESIQDMCEDALYRHGRKKTAKDFIKYRAKRDEERNKEKYGILSKEFLSRYKHIKPPMTQLGEFVYYRTYSRYLSNKKRREYWWETVKRAVEYNCSLTPTSKKEAEQLYDNMFYLRQFLSGRSLWVGGTDVSKYHCMSNYNCSFQIINEIESFRDVFYLLMIGSGAGIRILKDDVNMLPTFRGNIEVIHKEYSLLPANQREDNTSIEFFYNHTAKITIGDSKEGWVQSLNYFLKLLTEIDYRKIKTIILDYDNVRPKGEKLKTFGGTASGHEALLDMFKGISRIICNGKEKHKLKTIDCLDICNMIGEGVVVGGVRRTAEILLIDSDDEECIQAKSNLYKQSNGQWEVNKDLIHRQMSNNSIYYYKKPTREKLHWQIESMRYSGEPAWINAEVGRKRRQNFNGVNPCCEILLDNKGLCNLTTINVYAFITENGILDEEKLLQAQRLSARAGYRMTCVELELPKWNAVQQRDKLVGCSLTGWQDMCNYMNMNKEEQSKLLRKLKKVAHEEVERMANITSGNVPLLTCTVKPEGSLSQLPTVSSGIHYSHSPYYIRRVRINADDPLVKVVENLGFPIYPEVGQEWETCKTKVVEFPVKSPIGITKYDVSAIEQLENYIMFQKNYTDHNTSITIHVRPHEWQEVEEFVWNNWDDILAVSFLALDDSFYKLLPYEAITEEEYRQKMKEIENKFITPDKISKYEKEESQLDIGNDGCESGVCPVR